MCWTTTVETLDLLCRSPPPLCIWTGCFPLLWALGRWSLWGSRLSLSCPSCHPCSPQSSCSGTWWSGKPLWTAGGWRSSALRRCLMADFCCHKQTKSTNLYNMLSSGLIQKYSHTHRHTQLVCSCSHVFRCSCRLQTTQACSWRRSTTLYEVCWMGWQRCRSLQCPCCSALEWHPLHCLGLDPPSTHLHHKMEALK